MCTCCHVQTTKLPAKKQSPPFCLPGGSASKGELVQGCSPGRRQSCHSITSCVPAAQPQQWGNPQLLPPTAGMHFPGAWLCQRLSPALVPKAHTVKNRTMVRSRRKALCSGAGRKLGPVLRKSGQHSWLFVMTPGRMRDTFWVWQVAVSERSQLCPACAALATALYYNS